MEFELPYILRNVILVTCTVAFVAMVYWAIRYLNDDEASKKTKAALFGLIAFGIARAGVVMFESDFGVEPSGISQVLELRSHQLSDGWYRARIEEKNTDSQLSALHEDGKLDLVEAVGDLSLTIVHSTAGGGGSGSNEPVLMKGDNFSEPSDDFAVAVETSRQIVGWHVTAGYLITDVNVKSTPNAVGRYPVVVRPRNHETYVSGKTKNKHLPRYVELSAYVFPSNGQSSNSKQKSALSDK